MDSCMKDLGEYLLANRFQSWRSLFWPKILLLFLCWVIRCLSQCWPMTNPQSVTQCTRRLLFLLLALLRRFVAVLVYVELFLLIVGFAVVGRFFFPVWMWMVFSFWAVLLCIVRWNVRSSCKFCKWILESFTHVKVNFDKWLDAFIAWFIFSRCRCWQNWLLSCALWCWWSWYVSDEQYLWPIGVTCVCF